MVQNHLQTHRLFTLPPSIFARMSLSFGTSCPSYEGKDALDSLPPVDSLLALDVRRLFTSNPSYFREDDTIASSGFVGKV